MYIYIYISTKNVLLIPLSFIRRAPEDIETDNYLELSLMQPLNNVFLPTPRGPVRSPSTAHSTDGNCLLIISLL